MGYQYRGTRHDIEPEPEPAPQPKRKPGRPSRPGPSPCGTPGAYTRHRQKGEPIDDACRQANKDACKRRRDRLQDRPERK